jgi:hypothetical protein
METIRIKVDQVKGAIKKRHFEGNIFTEIPFFESYR